MSVLEVTICIILVTIKICLLLTHLKISLIKLRDNEKMLLELSVLISLQLLGRIIIEQLPLQLLQFQI